MSWSGTTEDRLAIRELVDTYSDAVCRRDADAWVATWAPDGVWVLRGRVIMGHAALREAWLAAMSAYRFVSFSAYPGAIEVEGDVARLRLQTTEWLTPVDGRPRRQHGCYEDQLARLAGRWHFAQRSFSVLDVQEF